MTQEILQGTYPTNLTAILDYYDDIELAEVVYSQAPALNALPRAIVLSPRINDVFAAGEDVVLSGQGVDPEDGDLGSTQLEWRDNSGNLLGAGSAVTVANLPVARQSVSLPVYDSTGQPTRHGVSVDVQ